jgi:rhodanese-related sulfurtransferase
MPTLQVRSSISSRRSIRNTVQVFKELAACDLKAWIESGKEFLLLDVREPAECALASVAGALEMPMRDVAARVGEIPPNKPVVVMCHYGERSAQVARFLAAGGIAEVYNLEGGIDAYASCADPAVGRY